MLKKIVFLSLLSTVSFAFAFECKGPLITNPQMNECAYSSYLDSDKRLNNLYKKILHKYMDYPAAYRNTIESERAWIKYRNAQVNMKFPPLKKGHVYGTIQTIYKYDYLDDMTLKRINELLEVFTDDYVDNLNG